MAAKAVLRDNRLIDALEAAPRVPFKKIVWRAVREGRDPRQCGVGRTLGRWELRSPLHVDRARRRDRRNVFSSLSWAACLSIEGAFHALGMDVARFGQLSYESRQQEYPRSQEIAEVAHFLDCDGIVVPHARWPCANVVLLCDAMTPDAIDVISDQGLIDWNAWQKSSGFKA